MSATNTVVSQYPQISSRYAHYARYHVLTDSPNESWSTIRAVVEDGWEEWGAASIGNGGASRRAGGIGSFNNSTSWESVVTAPGLKPGLAGRRRSRSLSSLLLEDKAALRRAAAEAATAVEGDGDDAVLDSRRKARRQQPHPPPPSPRTKEKLFNANDVVHHKLDLNFLAATLHSLRTVDDPPPQHHLPVNLSSLSRPSPAAVTTPPICAVLGNKTSSTPAAAGLAIAVHHQAAIENKFLANKPPPAALCTSLPSLADNYRHGQRQQASRPSCSSSNESRPVERRREVAQLKIETDGILARPGYQPPLQLDEEANHQQLMQHSMQVSASAAPPSPSTLSPKLARALSPVFEKFSFFKRGRKGKGEKGVNVVDAPSPKSLSSESQPSPTTPLSPNSTGPSIGTPDTGLSAGQKPAIASTTMPHNNYIEVGGRGIVPQIDAPRGASNHVSILCKGVPVDVPITNDTNARQVLEELTLLGQSINPDTAVITEHYSRFGLERRLRRQERIRDILNTWGSDAENTLTLSLDVRPTDKELDLSNVPKSDLAPQGFVVYMHYLRGPNKWSKRYITLHESGQMTAAKKPNPRVGDKDVVNLCHLSDYDIYTPTEAQMRKNLKPPKKYCFAVKSQQKASLFVNTSNYVHFFSTEDPNTAQKFRSHVHAWRSWYVANKLLELQKKDKRAPQTVPMQSPPRKSLREVGSGHGHKAKASVDESPYPVGNFEPLVDLKRPNKPLDDAGKDWTPAESSPEIVAPKPIPAAQAALIEANAAAFAANSLLGNGYEERRQQVQKEEKMATQLPYRGASPAAPVGPFTEGPSLLNQQAGFQHAVPSSPKAEYAARHGLDRLPMPSQLQSSKPGAAGGWFPSAVEHSARERVVSNPQQPPQQPISRRPSVSSRVPNRSMSTHQSQRGAGYSNGSVHDGGGHHRRSGQPGQPLIDLTPEFVEAPQWSREGRGRGVRAPEGKRLVDLATGPVTTNGPGRFHPESPPRALIHRREAPAAQQTLLQQHESRIASGSGGRPVTSGGPGALIGGMGMGSIGRRGTVKSSASGMGGGGMRPGTSGSYGHQGHAQAAGGGGGGGGAGGYPESSGGARARGMTVGDAVKDWNDGMGGQMGMSGGVEAWVGGQQQQLQHRRSRGMTTGGERTGERTGERIGQMKVVGGRVRSSADMMSQ